MLQGSKRRTELVLQGSKGRTEPVLQGRNGAAAPASRKCGNTRCSVTRRIQLLGVIREWGGVVVDGSF